MAVAQHVHGQFLSDRLSREETETLKRTASVYANNAIFLLSFVGKIQFHIPLCQNSRIAVSSAMITLVRLYV